MLVLGFAWERLQTFSSFIIDLVLVVFQHSSLTKSSPQADVDAILLSLITNRIHV